MKAVAAPSKVTTTGGRIASSRHIPPKLALAVGAPKTKAPANWRWCALSELARLESGHTPSRRHPEYWGGSVPWLSIRDAKACNGGSIDDTIEKTNALGIENSSARVLPAGTVCLSRTASVGYVVVMEQPMATSQDFVNWVCGEQLEPRFLQHLFAAEGESILRFASGAVHQTIYFPEAKGFYVCVPSRTEQQRIVAILDEAFDGIATAKANAERNLQNAADLFEKHLQSVFESRHAKWKSKKLGALTTKIGSGATPLGGEEAYKATGISLVRSLNVHDDGFRMRKLAFIDEVQASRLANVELKPMDVLLNITGASVARCCIVPNDVLPARVNQHVSIIRPAKDQLDAEFLHLLLIAKPNKDRLLGIGEEGGSTRQAITKAQIENFTISFPESIDEQISIVQELGALRIETQRLESLYQQKLAALDELKKSLLHEAFSGNL
ncbi:MAG: restriction endonuclease subunit S [Usitatibacteraceae bacterium]